MDTCPIELTDGVAKLADGYEINLLEGEWARAYPVFESCSIPRKWSIVIFDGTGYINRIIDWEFDMEEGTVVQIGECSIELKESPGTVEVTLVFPDSRCYLFKCQDDIWPIEVLPSEDYTHMKVITRNEEILYVFRVPLRKELEGRMGLN